MLQTMMIQALPSLTIRAPRLENIRTGSEDWMHLNRAAAASLERCVRVCRFKAQPSLLPYPLCHLTLANGSSSPYAVAALPRFATAQDASQAHQVWG